jgi:DNA-binding protein H-NS
MIMVGPWLDHGQQKHTNNGKERLMSRYKELQERIAALQKEAEEARQQEIAQVVVEIKTKMAEYGIRVEDLTPSRPKRRRKPSGPAKYRDPATGMTWTGKGRAPGWLRQALAEGKKMEDFVVV